MGDVWVGFDEALSRRVALKSIRPGMRREPGAQARFLREARVLSQLDHPNICRVFDLVRSEDGEFLVLELIEGRSLRAALGPAGLPFATAMRVAQQLVSALVAAHGRGVIHRDLKPENVMITTQGDVKVLDFGLARLAGTVLAETGLPGAGERERLSEQPASPPGPEPAQGVGDPTGSVADRTGLAEVVEDQGQESRNPVEPPGGRRAARAEDPEVLLDRPAAAADDAGREADFGTVAGAILGTLSYMSPEQATGGTVTAASDIYSLGLILQELFTGRRAYEPGLTEPGLLLKAARAETLPISGVDGELAALVERLKAAEPAARPSAIDVAERLRWIAAAPRRRRRRLVVAAAIAVMTLFSVAMTVQTLRVGRERDRANQEAQTARQVSDFLVGLFRVSHPERARGNTVTARELLDQGAERIRTELGGEPEVQARLLDTIGSVYAALGLYDEALPLLEGAVAIGRQGPRADEDRLATSLDHLACALVSLNRLDEAEPLLREAIAISQRLHGELAAETVSPVNNLASALWHRGEYDEATRLCERILEIRLRSSDPDDPNLATAYHNLGAILKEQQRGDEARPMFERALEIWERSLGPDHPSVAICLVNLAGVCGDTARERELYERALPLLERLFGAGHPNVAAALFNLGLVHHKLGDAGAAQTHIVRAQSIWETRLGPEHPMVGRTLNALGTIASGRRDFAAALGLQQRALTILERELGPDHYLVGQTLHGVATALEGLGRREESEALLRRSLAVVEGALGRDNPTWAEVAHSLGSVLVESGRFAEAEPLLREAVAGLERRGGAVDRRVTAASRELAQALRANGRVAEAEEVERRLGGSAAAAERRP